MEKETLTLDPAWEFKEFPQSARRMRDLDTEDWLSARVPSSIYTCLQDAGIISIPDLPSRAQSLDWVDAKSWVFRKVFDAPASLLEKQHSEIIFDGLDTVSHIWLNDKLIGKTENMFTPHRFDITPYLKQSQNKLYIKFVSAREYTDRLMHRYGKPGAHCLRDARSSYLRKAAYQFGSDMGPSLLGCGIFRPVRIQACNTAAIENLHLRTIDCNQHTADVRAAIELKRISSSSGALTCKIHVTGGGLDMTQQLLFNNDDTTASTVLRIERPFLWWPTGYGVQHLYHVRAELLSEDGQLIDAVCEDFGIRTVHVETVSENTEFIVNGQPIALKGAEWMPPSLFPGDRTDYEALLKKAGKCRINLLRVRADGCYENDDFYHLCDKMGILVWQDFMFDSAYYPDRQWFTENVKTEADSIVRKLRNHACIILWCGNNNIDHLHKIGKLGKGRKFYGKPIFHELLGGLIDELDPDREYIPTFSSSSPENPIRVHYAPDIPSPPCRNSLPAQTGIDSFDTLEELTQRNTALGKIALYQIDQFRPPQNLSEYIWQSQVVQARRVRAAAEKNRCSDDSGGCMLGALNSPALSVNAAMLDGRTQPKALFYYARRFFTPILVTLLPEEKNRLLKAFVVNDTASPVTGELCCRMVGADGRILDTTEMPIRVSPFSKVAAINLPRSMSRPDDPARTFLSVCLRNDGKLLAENTYFYCPDKQFQWAVADIDLQIAPDDDANAWEVTLACEVPVRDLQIIPPQPADISDNFLTLLPNEPRQVRILFDDPMPPIRTPLQLFSSNQITK